MPARPARLSAVLVTRILRNPLLAGGSVLVLWLVFAAVAPSTTLAEGAAAGAFWGSSLFLVLILGQYGRRRSRNRSVPEGLSHHRPDAHHP
jgi:hypothetical protein